MRKFTLILTAVVLIVGIGYICNFPMQKNQAKKIFKEYTHIQGIDEKNITSMNVVKDITQNGYDIFITLKDNPGITYDYHYTKLNSKTSSFKHMKLSYFKGEIGLNNDNKKIKYPSIKNKKD